MRESRGDHGLIPVGGQLDTVHHALAILATHRAHQHFFVRHRLQRSQNLGLFVAHHVGVERHRRLHGSQRDELENVVRHHVAQRARFVVIGPALFDAYRLRHRDLDVVDVAPVPNRLEDSVREAEDQDILDGLFSQVVIDPVDLLFVQHLPDFLVQAARRFVVAPKRFFDDHAPPAMFFGNQICRPQLLDDGGEKVGSRSQVIKIVAARAVLLVDVSQNAAQLFINLRIVEIARDVVNPAREPMPQVRIDLGGGKIADLLADHVAKLLAVHLIASHAHQRKFLRKQIILGEIVERRDQLALGQVARSAEYHHHARIGRPARAGGIPFRSCFFSDLHS